MKTWEQGRILQQKAKYNTVAMYVPSALNCLCTKSSQSYSSWSGISQPVDAVGVISVYAEISEGLCVLHRMVDENYFIVDSFFKNVTHD